MLAIHYLAVAAEVSRFTVATRKLAAFAETLFAAVGKVRSFSC